MIIEEILKKQELKIKETIKKENKTFKDIFNILEYYVFNSDKITNRSEMILNIDKLSFKLLENIDNLREEMFENCMKDSNNHEYMDLLDLLIRFLPKEADLSVLNTAKNILEEDFEPTYDI